MVLLLNRKTVISIEGFEQCRRFVWGQADDDAGDMIGCELGQKCEQ